MTNACHRSLTIDIFRIPATPGRSYMLTVPHDFRAAQTTFHKRRNDPSWLTLMLPLCCYAKQYLHGVHRGIHPRWPYCILYIQAGATAARVLHPRKRTGRDDADPRAYSNTNSAPHTQGTTVGKHVGVYSVPVHA